MTESLSLRTALEESGIAVDAVPFAVRAGVKRWPDDGSLRTVIRAFRDPRLRDWTELSREFTNKDWTASCQGVATDGRRWFITSNAGDFPGVYRLSASLRAVTAKREVPRSLASHVGDLDVSDRILYVALEGPTQLARLTVDLELIDVSPVETPDGHFAWCAISPWNGKLYTSAWMAADTLYAYEPSDGSRLAGLDIALNGKVDRVQGGTFSPNGRVYLASDDKRGAPGIHAFGLLTGRSLGRITLDVNQGFPNFDEVEGIGFGQMPTLGLPTHVHMILLDQDWPSGDDVRFMSYGVPDPAVV